MTTLTPDPALQVYGIANCSTVKKARQWLTDQGQDYQFHDFKKAAPQAADITRWQQAVGWEKLLNRQGQTWRKLDAATQASITDAASAAAFLQQQPSAIKRPVVQWPSGNITIGFNPEDWQQLLTHAG
ncbi:ArsC family reductase [Comamonas denitrificans]|uniref:ArsC family reductase n=1 Tax=Comamonas denitrificans TaxID=117506 RepID=A0A939GVE4_9BURK|nr:ArsC family reductase [Comamonas denitrificans]MBO1249725.1 ArsC family reductase [Comamonas denitrificans]